MILYYEVHYYVRRIAFKFGSFALRRKIGVRELFAEFRSERLGRELTEYLSTGA